MNSVFLTYVKDQMWMKRYAKRTIESYLYLIKAFIIFNNKKHPLAAMTQFWHYLFPSYRLSTDPESSKLRRHHIDENTLRKFVKSAAKEVNIEKMSRVIYYVIPLQHICYTVALIFEPYKRN